MNDSRRLNCNIRKPNTFTFYSELSSSTQISYSLAHPLKYLLYWTHFSPGWQLVGAVCPFLPHCSPSNAGHRRAPPPQRSVPGKEVSGARHPPGLETNAHGTLPPHTHENGSEKHHSGFTQAVMNPQYCLPRPSLEPLIEESHLEVPSWRHGLELEQRCRHWL